MTDTKLIVNLELREKFTQGKKTLEFHDNETENISGESIEGAALIRGRRLLTLGTLSKHWRRRGGHQPEVKFPALELIIIITWSFARVLLQWRR